MDKSSKSSSVEEHNNSTARTSQRTDASESKSDNMKRKRQAKSNASSDEANDSLSNLQVYEQANAHANAQANARANAQAVQPIHRHLNIIELPIDPIIHMICKMPYDDFRTFISVLIPKTQFNFDRQIADREKVTFRTKATLFAGANYTRNRNVQLLQDFARAAQLEVLAWDAPINIHSTIQPFEYKYVVLNLRDAGLDGLAPYYGAGLRTIEFAGNSPVLAGFRFAAPYWSNLSRVTILSETPLYNYLIVEAVHQLPHLLHLHIYTASFNTFIEFEDDDHSPLHLNEQTLNRLESLYLVSVKPVPTSIVRFEANPRFERLRHLRVVNIRDGEAFLERDASLQLRARL